MPPKKKPRNPFLIFTMEWRSKEEKRGNRLSMREATDLAGKIWEEMKPSERAPYTEVAKRERLDSRNSDEKYTSQGVPLSHIENEKRERDTEERLMKKYIEDTIKRAVINNDLPDQRFYFIMANYFAKTVEGNIFVPAEIALSSYSLREGVNNTFHSCINPEVGIFGHAYEAMRHTESTHKLPLPPNAIGEKKLGKLYTEILKFIQSTDGSKEYPPVFTHKESIPIIKSVLDSMRFDGLTQDVELKVYPIQYLFYTLKKATAQLGEVKMPESIFVTDVIFDRDTYEYHQGISCNYHEKMDNSKFCALSCVVRWGYMFSDYMCLDLALQLIPGRHVPVNADLTIPTGDDSKIFSDTESLVSERTYASTFTDITQPKRERYDDIESSVSCNLNKNDKNFPALGARPKVKSYAGSDAGTSKYGDGDEDNKSDDNPWAVRSKTRARLPNDDSFSFASVGGRGRGLYIKSESPAPALSRTGYGRGRYFDEN